MKVEAKSRWSWREWLKNAFAVDVDGEPLSEEDQVILTKIASFIVRRGMSTPALLLLESVKPLNFVGSQAMLFFEPILKSLFHADNYERVRLILERREGIELLLTKVEEIESGQGESPEPASDDDPIELQPSLDKEG